MIVDECGLNGIVMLDATAPAVSQDGLLWRDPATGTLYVSVNGGTWQAVGGATGPVTPLVTVSNTAPTAPQPGDLWLNTSSSPGELSVYQDGVNRWVLLLGSTFIPKATKANQIISSAKSSKHPWELRDTIDDGRY
jgi:hypothetical protein